MNISVSDALQNTNPMLCLSGGRGGWGRRSGVPGCKGGGTGERGRGPGKEGTAVASAAMPEGASGHGGRESQGEVQIESMIPSLRVAIAI